MTDALIPVPVDDPLRLAWFECNDFGNGRRLVELSRGLLKWVDDKFWVAFDGQRWSEREGGYRARALAHEVAQHIHDEAAALGALVGDPKSPNAQGLIERFGDWCSPQLATDRLTMLHKHAIKSGNAAQTAAMLTQAKDMGPMRAWSEDFDVDTLTYNVANGTLRFRKQDGGRWGVVFQEGHEPTDMLMQIANVDYDPAATCPMWTDRLALVQPDDGQRAIFPRMYGQTLTGLTDCEEFYVHKGRGGDGKTKTHEIIAEIHGDYYRHSPVKTFLQASFQKSGSEHRSDLVRLKGDYRMILTDEPPPRVTWDGETLKQFTGGGTITARGSGAVTEITFKPRGKLFVEVNPLPNMPGDDKGFRRRFRLVLWPVDLARIEGGFEPPEQLRQRLLTEKSGILNWMIAGCLDWLGDRRVPVPDIETEALVDFWAQSSPFGEWIDEACDLTDREATESPGVLLTAFKAWMVAAGQEEEAVKKWNPTKFGRELTQRQIISVKNRIGNKVRRGIKLRAADPLLRDHDGASGAERNAGPAKPAAAADDLGWPADEDFGDDLGGDPLGGGA
ncbi:MAG: phage/plasmid primase, P4 family [Novosphingobium sp.]